MHSFLFFKEASESQLCFVSRHDSFSVESTYNIHRRVDYPMGKETTEKVKGPVTVVCECGNALWEITKCEARSIMVDFRCRCTSCGKEPTRSDLSRRLYYGLAFTGYIEVQSGIRSIRTGLSLTATHVFCARCLKEDRSQIHDRDHSLENLFADPQGGWKKVSFEYCTDYNPGIGVGTFVLCNGCAQDDDLKQWIKKTYCSDDYDNDKGKETLKIVM